MAQRFCFISSVTASMVTGTITNFGCPGTNVDHDSIGYLYNTVGSWYSTLKDLKKNRIQMTKCSTMVQKSPVSNKNVSCHLTTLQIAKVNTLNSNPCIKRSICHCSKEFWHLRSVAGYTFRGQISLYTAIRILK